MTYSTCTIHHQENEEMVRYLLDEYHPTMELVPINVPLGGPGLPGLGLSADECNAVRRFDPSDTDSDTMGFFVAKFRKSVVGSRGILLVAYRAKHTNIRVLAGLLLVVATSHIHYGRVASQSASTRLST